eukprot:5754724-Amphidinium_carterae.3
MANQLLFSNPLGVYPLGNSLLLEGGLAKQRLCLGSFAKLGDELLLATLRALGAKLCGRMATVSFVFRAFCYQEELWRDFCLETIHKGIAFSWVRDWRTSYSADSIEESKVTAKGARGLKKSPTTSSCAMAFESLFSTSGSKISALHMNVEHSGLTCVVCVHSHAKSVVGSCGRAESVHLEITPNVTEARMQKETLHARSVHRTRLQRCPLARLLLCCYQAEQIMA